MTLPAGQSTTRTRLARLAIGWAGYCGFLLAPPVIGVIADRFTLGTGLAVVAIPLTVIAPGGARIASQGGAGQWMV